MFQAARRSLVHCRRCHAACFRPLTQQVGGQQERGRSVGRFADVGFTVGFADAERHHRFRLQCLHRPTPPFSFSFQSPSAESYYPTHLRNDVRCRSTSTPGGGPDLDPGPQPARELYKGLAALLLVAFIWGSYAPVYKYLFMLPRPPSCQLINATQTTISALLLLTASLLNRMPSSKSSTQQREQSGSSSLHPPWDDQPSSGTAGAASSARPMMRMQRLVARTLTWQPSSLLVAGCELAIYTCGAIALCTLGLQLTSATKAAFLTQSACLFTPLLSAMAGQRMGKGIWASSCLGLLGSLLILMDAPGAAAAATGADMAVATGQLAGLTPALDLELHGQTLILASAALYSLVTFRMDQSLRRHGPLDLACSSNCAQAVIFCAVLAAPMLHDPGAAAALAEEVQRVLADGGGAAALLWLGAGPGALAAFLQTTGQRRVPAAQAQVVFTTSPLWSALLAACLLHNEVMGPQAWLGGFAVMAAALFMLIS